MKVSLIVPTWNEIDGMRAIMPRINKDWVDEIVVVDGGSTDGTIEYAKENGYTVHVQKNPGMRQAYLEVLPVARGDTWITFSPDGNSVPEIIPTLVEEIKKGYDMVIVSRYLGGAKSDDDDLVTAFGNWFFTKTVNVLFGARYTDVMVIFRAYRSSLIQQLELDQDEGFRLAEALFRTKISWEPLMSVRAAKRKLKVSEIPGDEPARIGGERKLQIIRWGGACYVQFIREVFMWRGRKI